MRTYRQQRRDFIELALKIIDLGHKSSLGVFSAHVNSATFDYDGIQFLIKESWRWEHNEEQVQELWKVLERDKYGNQLYTKSLGLY